MIALLSLLVATATAANCVTCQTDCIVGGSAPTHATFAAATAASCSCIDLQGAVQGPLHIASPMTVLSSNGQGVVNTIDDGIDITTVGQVVISRLDLVGDGTGRGIDSNMLDADLVVCDTAIDDFSHGIRSLGDLDLRDSALDDIGIYGMHIGGEGAVVDIDGVIITNVGNRAIYGTSGSVVKPVYTFSQMLLSATRGVYITGGDTTIQGGVVSFTTGSTPVYQKTGTLTVVGTEFEWNQGSTSGAVALVNGTALTVEHTSFHDNEGSAGAVYASSANVTIEDSAFEDNHSTGTGGGAMRFSSCDVTLDTNLVERSSADGDGGAVYASGGTLAVLDNDFHDASAVGDGGMLYLDDVDADISGSTFSFGQASNGGGFYAVDEELDISDSTLTSMVATSEGGAFYLDYQDLVLTDVELQQASAAWGGGVYASRKSNIQVLRGLLEDLDVTEDGGAFYVESLATLDVQRSTAIDCEADERGGVVYSEGDVDILNSTLVYNEADEGGNLYLADGDAVVRFATIVEGMAGTDHSVAVVAPAATLFLESSAVEGNGANNCSGVVNTVASYEIDGSCGGMAMGLTGLGLGPYQNGYMPPLAGSVLIEGGKSCVANDQIGAPRPSSLCDAGAIEQ